MRQLRRLGGSNRTESDRGNRRRPHCVAREFGQELPFEKQGIQYISLDVTVHSPQLKQRNEPSPAGGPSPHPAPTGMSAVQR